MIGIIAAMEKELAFLKKYIENPVTRVISGVSFISGKIYGRDVVAAVCGIGKVNAAVCAQSMMLTYAPDCVINTGVAGSLSGDLHISDVVAADKLVQHDVDTTALGDAPGFVSTVNTVYFPTDEALACALLKAMKVTGVNGTSGTIATGDQFVCTKAQKQLIAERFGAVACEMEGGAIAHACLLNKTPCAILRAISDGADEDADMSYSAFAEKAAENSAKTLLSFIQNF